MRRKAGELGIPDPNALWLSQNRKILENQFPGKVVAIQDQGVIYQALTLEEMMTYVREKKFLTRPYLYSVPDPEKETLE